jgi:hypothetical protein
MRMMVGLALAIQMAQYCLTSAGQDVLTFAFADVSHGGYRSVQPTLLLTLFGGAQPTQLLVLASCNLAMGLCLLLGLFGRLPALLAWLLSASIIGPSSPVSGGGDLLLLASLFTLGLSDCTRTLSLDCRLRTGVWTSSELVPAWPRILALFQLAVMYGATGLQKLVSTTWLPADGYSALYQILQSPHWARFPSIIEDADGLFVWPAAIATALTVPWELTFPAVLFFRRLRPAYALFGVMLHLGIGLTMNVGSFGLLSLAFYPTLFPRWRGPSWRGLEWRSPRNTPSPSG